MNVTLSQGVGDSEDSNMSLCHHGQDLASEYKRKKSTHVRAGRISSIWMASINRSQTPSGDEYVTDLSDDPPKQKSNRILLVGDIEIGINRRSDNLLWEKEKVNGNEFNPISRDGANHFWESFRPIKAR